MLHILLLILKITGIIVGTLFAVLLICLLTALFVPVRYRIEARRTEEEGAPPIEASVKITWLLHLINIRLQYPAKVYFRARIWLFTVFRLPPKPKKTDDGKTPVKEKGGKKEHTEKAAKKSNIENDGQKPAGAEKIRELETVTNTESVQCPEPENATGTEDERPVPGSENAQKQASAEQKVPFWEKFREKIMQIRGIFQKIWYTLTGICDKIKTIWENIEYYMGILQSDTFKQAFSLCKEELLSIFSYIRPRKFQADLIIGMDDPAATGKILSYYGMLYPFVGGHINVDSDFKRKRLEGAVFIKGKIRLFTFIKAVLRIYFNKDIRKLLKLFKKEEL